METIKQQKEFKARKNHRCDYCNGTIDKSDKYMKSTHVYDGMIYDWKSHHKCNDLTSLLSMGGEEGITDDIFNEEVCEAYNNFFPNDIERVDLSFMIEVLHTRLKG